MENKETTLKIKERASPQVQKRFLKAVSKYYEKSSQNYCFHYINFESINNFEKLHLKTNEVQFPRKKINCQNGIKNRKSK